MYQRKRKLAVLGCMACLSLSVLSCPIATLPVQAAVREEEAVMPMSHDIQWVYTTRDGEVYKRLYNYTTGTWVGDWIHVPREKARDPHPEKH